MAVSGSVEANAKQPQVSVALEAKLTWFADPLDLREVCMTEVAERARCYVEENAWSIGSASLLQLLTDSWLYANAPVSQLPN